MSESRDHAPSISAVTSGHTPGPWKIVSRSVADDGWNIYAESDYGIGKTWDCNGFAENEANARLITAAPELLEALKACEALIVDLAESGDAGFWDAGEAPEVIAARSAIAKAEGR